MTTLLTILIPFGLAQSSLPDTFSPHRVEHGESIIAFITFKAGIASGLVDNNLTYPSEYDLDLRVGDTIEDVEFRFRLRTEDLVVNDYEIQQRWFPRLRALDIVDEPFDKTSESQRRRIKRVILSEDQLDAEQFPVIRAQCAGISADPDTGPNAYRIALEITIHGETVTVEWPATIQQTNDSLIIELDGLLSFSDFGIEPYRRLFGAIRYRDDFHVYARLVAERATPHEARPGSP